MTQTLVLSTKFLKHHMINISCYCTSRGRLQLRNDELQFADANGECLKPLLKGRAIHTPRSFPLVQMHLKRFRLVLKTACSLMRRRKIRNKLRSFLRPWWRDSKRIGWSRRHRQINCRRPK